MSLYQLRNVEAVKAFSLVSRARSCVHMLLTYYSSECAGQKCSQRPNFCGQIRRLQRQRARAKNLRVFLLSAPHPQQSPPFFFAVRLFLLSASIPLSLSRLPRSSQQRKPAYIFCTSSTRLSLLSLFLSSSFTPFPHATLTHTPTAHALLPLTYPSLPPLAHTKYTRIIHNGQVCCYSQAQEGRLAQGLCHQGQEGGCPQGHQA